MARAIILAASALVLALGACASPVEEPVMAPPPAASAPAAQAAPGPAASAATVPTPAPANARRPDDDDDTVVVPGQVQRQLPTPADPRSTTQRMADIRAWDECVMRVQGRAEDATRPQMDTPEDVCRRSLGMSDRTSVPNSRR